MPATGLFPVALGSVLARRPEARNLLPDTFRPRWFDSKSPLYLPREFSDTASYMKHATLYRKWRPRRFGEIVGQEPVVRTLERAIETGRVSHAYLFSGPRGTGKTSTAKVLAMGLNCEKGPTPDPDGTCESCRAITSNSSLDVVEMDAASNRGIDEIRELRDRVNLAPVASRTKVYIIDEVHMLTPEAFNALLKMLEEPPEHVVFVLATTEKHKVLPTIISRCQSFDFRRPGVDTLSKKLAEIADAEGIEVGPEALTVIARGGGGSFRDAEGLLDQLSSFAEGRVTASMVRELLGSVGPEALLETTAALHERRAADALRVVDRLSNEGKDLGQFASELLSHLRILMLLPYAPEVALSEVGVDERGPLEEQSRTIPTAEVVRLIEALGDARGRIKRGGDPKLELELSFLKLARDYAEPQVDVLLRRLETLELAVENGAFAASSAPDSRSGGVDPAYEPHDGVEVEQEDVVEIEVDTTGAPPRGEARVPESPRVGGSDAVEPAASAGVDEAGDDRIGVGELSSRWRRLMEELKRSRQALTATVFQEGHPVSFDGNVLEIEFPADADFHAKEARKARHGDALRNVLEEHLGVRPRLEFRVAGSDGGGVVVEEPRQGPPAADGSGAAVGPRPVSGGADVPPPERPEAREDGREYGAGRAERRGDAGGPAGASGGNGAAGVQAEAAGADDIIRDQGEVFRMARERFGLFDQNQGS